jgi:hypothetical protein
VDNTVFAPVTAVSSLPSLQIPPSTSGAAPTPQQKRFNTLIRQIGKARETLAAWRENVPLYRQAHAQMLGPLREELQAAFRQWIVRLDALLDERRWTHAEGATLRELICAGATQVLAAREDAQLKALYDKHSEVDFDTGQREMTLAMKALAEEMMGVDLGDDEGIESEEALRARMREAVAQEQAAREAKREARAARAARKPRSAAQLRREAEAQQATLSLREIYRKLASALHPDREKDEAERAAKTELMQRVNQAYAAGDLLALLELQLRIEQIDASHAATASESRLKHYNKVLAEQLAELKSEIDDTQTRWFVEFDLPPFTEADPHRLAKVLDETKHEWLADLARLQQELRMFDDVPATKQWLKRERKRLEEDDPFNPFDLGF